MDERISKLKNIHKGERCFIIGTGPSLNKTNLSLIKDEIIFGVNILYRTLPRYGINCRYYAVSDGQFWKHHYQNLLSLDTTLFLAKDSGGDYLRNQEFYQGLERNKPIVIKSLGKIQDYHKISTDLSEGLYEGTTVIIDICLQAAYHMGFKRAYLLGCDCENWELHFDGSPPSVPIPSSHGRDVLAAYEICKRVYEEDGREIINATVGGKLEVFRREKLEDVV